MLRVLKKSELILGISTRYVFFIVFCDIVQSPCLSKTVLARVFYFVNIDSRIFSLICGVFTRQKGVQKMHAIIDKQTNYAILAICFASLETLREARFFGIVLPAAFIILLSALRTAATAAALSPDAIAFNAFLFSVFTALRRAVLTAFFLSVTKILFLDDL